MAEIEKIDLESKDLVEDRLAKLREMMPEVFSESGIDFDKLRLELGDEVDEGQERYAFTWPGKADAIRQSQTPSTATLRPCIEKSRGRDGEDGSFDSDNIYIEGDNLEVLKLLQRGYHGKVKMIYIDPPYNTGHDFVYKDKFGDTIENYKEQTGLSGQSNADTSGRYHSDWCSMMYPRLKLARELMSDDAFIFISIDDSELQNLQFICSEIFGSTCVETYIWDTREPGEMPKTAKNTVRKEHEYIVTAFKSSDARLGKYSSLKYVNSRGFSNPDDDPRGNWMSGNISRGTTAAEKGSKFYTITNPAGISFSRNWSIDEEEYKSLLADGRIFFADGGKGVPRRKIFQNEPVESIQSSLFDDVRSSRHGSKQLEALDMKGCFDHPKPTELIERLAELTLSDEDLAIDFFSGSATAAHALMNFVKKTGTKCHYILVQLPENLDMALETASNDTRKSVEQAISLLDSISKPHTLSEIGEERIRRSGDKIKAEVEEDNKQPKLGEEPKKLPDIGFRVFRLDDSSIEKPEPGKLMLDVVKPDRTDEDIVFEMMLKWGLELTLPVEKEEMAGYPVYTVAYGELVCCLAPGLSMETLEAIAEMEPRRVLMRDSILTDTLKLNAVQAFKRVEERTGREVELRTV